MNDWLQIGIGALVTVIGIWFLYRQGKDNRDELKGDIKGVRGELGDTRDELKQDITGVRDELKGDIKDVRRELKDTRDELKGEIKDVRDELKGDINQVSNRLFDVWETLTKIFAQKSSDNPFTEARAPQFNYKEALKKSLDQKKPTHKAASLISLTSRGVEIAKALEAEAIIEKYRQHILIPDDAQKASIQDICFDFAFNRLLQIIDSDQKQIIEKAISEEAGIRGSILFIYGVLFRNSFFQERNYPVPKNGDSNKKKDKDKKNK